MVHLGFLDYYIRNIWRKKDEIHCIQCKYLRTIVIGNEEIEECTKNIIWKRLPKFIKFGEFIKWFNNHSPLILNKKNDCKNFKEGTVIIFDEYIDY